MHNISTRKRTEKPISCWCEIASRLPNNTFVIVLELLVARELKNKPSPVANANVVPVTTSRSEARFPNAPMTSAPPAQNTARPSTGGMPSSTAPVAPGSPMWARACAAKALRRTTMK